jgi:hypothetical protein
MSYRNIELAVAQKQDPERFRTRVVETKKRKLRHNRARQKEAFLSGTRRGEWS